MRSPRRIGVGGWFLRAYVAGFGAVFGICTALGIGGLFFVVLTTVGTMFLSGGSPIEIDLSGNGGSTPSRTPGYGSSNSFGPAVYSSSGESVQAAQYTAADYPSPSPYGAPSAVPSPAPYSSPSMSPYPPSPAASAVPPVLPPTLAELAPASLPAPAERAPEVDPESAPEPKPSVAEAEESPEDRSPVEPPTTPSEGA